MKYLISAIQFITILPVGKNREYHPTGMLAYYPVVGLIIGMLLCIVDGVAGCLWTAPAVAVIDVIFIICVTGAFHLDGLADAADGLFSHRPREEQLEIMKDSRTGVMGVVAIFCILGLKWAGIASLPESGYGRYVLLLIIPAYARASILFGIRFLDYGRKEGTGRGHFNEPLQWNSFIRITIPVAVSLTLGLRGLWLNLCFLLVVFMIITLYKKKLGCITGDLLGAMTETTEALLFLLAAVCVL